MTLRAPPERLVLLAGLSCLLLAGAARANPDVWASYAVVYRLEHRTAVGLTLEWRFDPFFSHRAMTAFDENGDGAFDGDEAGRLEAELVEPLARRGFYLHVLAGGEPRAFSLATFEPALEGSSLVYRFTVDFEPPVPYAREPLVVSLHDAEVYYDFAFAPEDFLLVQGMLEPDCGFRVGPGTGPLSGHRRTITLACAEAS